MRLGDLPVTPPPEDYPRLFDRLPANFGDDLHTKPEVQRAWRHVRNREHVVGRIDADDHDTWLRSLDYYAWLHIELDRSLARLLDALDALGLYDGTVIAYTSDHGDACGSHGLRAKLPCVYDEVRRAADRQGPGVPGRGPNRSAATHVDLAPHRRARRRRPRRTRPHSRAGTVTGAGPTRAPRCATSCCSPRTRPSPSDPQHPLRGAGLLRRRDQVRRYLRHRGRGARDGTADEQGKLFDVDADFDDPGPRVVRDRRRPHELANLANDRGRRDELRALFRRLLDYEAQELTLDTNELAPPTPRTNGASDDNRAPALTWSQAPGSGGRLGHRLRPRRRRLRGPGPRDLGPSCAASARGPQQPAMEGPGCRCATKTSAPSPRTPTRSAQRVIVAQRRPEIPAPVGFAPPITSDPPFHRIAREFLLPGLRAQPIEAKREATRETCRELLDDLLAGVAEGRTDIVDAALGYTQHIPVRVMADMLGVPRSDGDQFRIFIHQIMEAPGTALQVDYEDSIDFYLDTLIAARAERPQDDLISHMTHATIEGHSLQHEHVRGTCGLLIVAGVDTTWSAIGASLWHMAQHPEDRRRWTEDPEIRPFAVEEFLRFYAPVTMARLLAKDAEFAGRSMRANDWVLLPFPAANRDPEAFEDAGEFVIDRMRNRHVAFGLGIHRCLGSNLARMELTVALEEWMARVPDFELADPGGRHLVGGRSAGPAGCRCASSAAPPPESRERKPVI